MEVYLFFYTLRNIFSHKLHLKLADKAFIWAAWVSPFPLGKISIAIVRKEES